MRAHGIAAAAALLNTAASAETITNRADVIAAEVRTEETGWEGDHLTGDWGGLRERLVERGLHFQAGYAAEAMANVSGGIRRGAVFEGLLELGLELEFEKLAGWKGTKMRASGLYPHGKGLSEKYLGDLQTVSNIDAFDSFRLYEFWFEQTFGAGRFSLRLGQLLADEEFAYTGPGSYFLNSSFGWPAFISANTLNTGPAFFAAASGARLRYEPRDSVFVQAAVFDGDTFDSAAGDPRPNASGTRIHLSGGQGVFAIAEAGLKINQDEGAGGLPGEFKIGAWIHTGEFPSNFEDANGRPFVLTGEEPRLESENFGAYIAAQQMVWREEQEQGLYLFARAGGSPRDRSLFEFVFDGGMNYKGLIPTRDEDLFGAGAAYARVSSDVRRRERLDAAANGAAYPGFSDFEAVLEIFYSLQLTKWWTVQPDFQWIFNPGGSRAASDAVVVGVRTTFVF